MANKNVTEYANDIARVLRFYSVEFDESKAEQSILCPFHEDINPSCKLNLDTNTFYCFGCGKHGGPMEFVKYAEDVDSDLVALQILAGISDCNNVDENHIVKSKSTKNDKKIFTPQELYDQSWDYFYGLKKTNWKRPEIEEELEVRNYMKERGFEAQTLVKSLAKYTYKDNYPIIFPLIDNNKFRGWVERTTNPEIEKKRKYLYNTGFKRRSTLVGNYGMKNYVFVVEGFMDRLKFNQFGIDNVVAILGWKISDEQIQKLKANNINRIICATDNDRAGIQGYEYFKRLKCFDTKRFQFMKNIKDPGEMNKRNFEKMMKRTLKIIREDYC